MKTEIHEMRHEILSHPFKSLNPDVKLRSDSCKDSSKEIRKHDDDVCHKQDSLIHSDKIRHMNESPREANIEYREPTTTMKRLLCLSMREVETNQDKNIGLRLALPDKIDVMRGLQAPTAFQEHGIAESPFSKKLMIVPDYNIPSQLASFRRISLGTPIHLHVPSVKHDDDNIDNDEFERKKEEIVIRTSELEPSVHQLVIPSATDLLIHARICSLLEGYDHLLESRAKARKTWFDFSSLVGLDR